jgi:hypothetical protein
MIKVRAPSIRPVDFSLLGFRFSWASVTMQTDATFQVNTGGGDPNLTLEDGVLRRFDRARHPQIRSSRLAIALWVVDQGHRAAQLLESPDAVEILREAPRPPFPRSLPRQSYLWRVRDHFLLHG